MRDLNKQEQDSINEYIDKISIKTGINLVNILDGKSEINLKEMEDDSVREGEADR